MKSFFSISLLLLYYTLLFSQNIQTQGSLIFKDTLTFAPLHPWINVPVTNKLWEIGIPNKAGMTDSYDGASAIVTKLNGNYSLNSNDFFEIKIPLSYSWGEGILSFWHKYETDSLNDGGIIEISHDDGKSWTNIINDNYGISVNYDGIYTQNDTIIGGIPAFKGKSESWKKVELYWWWLALTKSTTSNSRIIRFKFHSENNSITKSGWEISHIEFKGFSVLGAIKNNDESNISIYPNPTTKNIKVKVQNIQKNMTFKLYNEMGNRLFEVPISRLSQEFSLENYPTGNYIYSINQCEVIIKSGQIIKK